MVPELIPSRGWIQTQVSIEAIGRLFPPITRDPGFHGWLFSGVKVDNEHKSTNQDSASYGKEIKCLGGLRALPTVKLNKKYEMLVAIRAKNMHVLIDQTTQRNGQTR